MFPLTDIDFSWRESDLQSVLPIMLALIGFLVYWALAHSPRIKARYYDRYPFDEASARHILFTKYLGLTTMGVAPAVVCLIFLPEFGLADYGLTYLPETALASAGWIIALGIPVFLLARYNASKPAHLEKYPQIRARKWTRRLMLRNAAGWAFYLFGYEWLFRGILLFPLVPVLGVYPAVAVNIALYSATHIPKGIDEAIGAIPFGMVLCLITLATGTIWVAFFVHLIMAWTSSFYALRHHPEMEVIR